MRCRCGNDFCYRCGNKDCTCGKYPLQPMYYPQCRKNNNSQKNKKKNKQNNDIAPQDNEDSLNYDQFNYLPY